MGLGPGTIKSFQVGELRGNQQGRLRKVGVPEAKRTENFRTEEVISCVKSVSKRDGHCFKATQ